MNDFDPNPDGAGSWPLQKPTAPLLTVASVRFMMTRADKQALRDLGYSDEAISHMTPDVGAEIIASRAVAPRAEDKAQVAQESKQEEALTLPSKTVVPAPLFTYAPLVLRPLKQWICWRYEWRREKWDKVPYMALGLSKDGRPYGASTAKPKHWRTLDDARRAYEASQSWREPFNGIGFVFDGEIGADGLCWCGVDFDAWTELEQALYRKLGPTYTEWSPSGRGVHALARAKPFAGAQSNLNPKDSDASKLRAEAYSWRRFFTFTGRLFEGAPTTVEARPDEIADIVDDIEQARTSAPFHRHLTKTAPLLDYNGEPAIQSKIIDDYLAALPDRGESEWDDLTYLPLEPVDLDKLASAMAALPEELFLEGNWVNFPCRALANEAERANDPVPLNNYTICSTFTRKLKISRATTRKITVKCSSAACSITDTRGDRY
jgi:hypothetical protein